MNKFVNLNWQRCSYEEAARPSLSADVFARFSELPPQPAAGEMRVNKFTKLLKKQINKLAHLMNWKFPDKPTRFVTRAQNQIFFDTLKHF